MVYHRDGKNGADASSLFGLCPPHDVSEGSEGSEGSEDKKSLVDRPTDLWVAVKSIWTQDQGDV